MAVFSINIDVIKPLTDGKSSYDLFVIGDPDVELFNLTLKDDTSIEIISIIEDYTLYNSTKSEIVISGINADPSIRLKYLSNYVQDADIPLHIPISALADGDNTNLIIETTTSNKLENTESIIINFYLVDSNGSYSEMAICSFNKRYS